MKTLALLLLLASCHIIDVPPIPEPELEIGPDEAKIEAYVLNVKDGIAHMVVLDVIKVGRTFYYLLEEGSTIKVHTYKPLMAGKNTYIIKEFEGRLSLK